MKFPKITKYRKVHRSLLSKRGKKVQERRNIENGPQLALVACGAGRITASQIEAGRLLLARCTKRRAKVSIPVFPSFGVTAKSDNSRIGKGKGNVSY
jgi:large subunit ribosomal protein L16